MATVRDEILQCLQLGGRQSAREVALALGRNEKLVMRLLRELADNGVVVFDRVAELRMLRLRGWCVRRVVVRYYLLPVRSAVRNPWEERWTK